MQSDEVGNEGEVEGLTVPEFWDVPALSIPSEGKRTSNYVIFLRITFLFTNIQSSPKILRNKMIARQ